MVDGRIHRPTVEQQVALDAFAGGGPLRIQAGSGTGKTTTLAMLARSTPRVGTYLAFNKEIASDARRAMPATVDSRTVHSIARTAILYDYPHGRALLQRLDSGRVSPWQAARHLDLGHLVVTIPNPHGAPHRKVLQPNWQAGHIQRAVTVFCQSADPEPDTQHFPYVDGIDPPGPDGRRTYANNDRVALELLPALRRAWADLCTPTGRLRFGHDIYLKLWQLGKYQIPGEFILFDEAQDASPVMLAALNAQVDKQIVYVGDSQQQIYAWRGAVDAMDLLDPATPTVFLTQSWRFGPAIAEVANLVLAELGAELRLTGTPSINSTVHLAGGRVRPHAVLCRTNAVAVEVVLGFQERGLSPHLVGGADEIVRFAAAAAQLQNGERTGHPELACFDSWREVQDYVADDPQGAELKMLVGLIDSYGVDIVIEALTGLAAQSEADVVVSTAHKAKGREWQSVRLAPDFEPPEDATLSHAEYRLLYVAATRAMHDLDLSTCLPLRRLTEARSALRPVG